MRHIPTVGALLRVVRVITADDHTVTRFGVRAMLAADVRLQVVGEADDGPSAVRHVLNLRPDILLLDLEMPGMQGIEALREITRRCPRVRTIILTATITPEQMVEALQIGARGIVQKDSAVSELVASIHAVLTGHHWIQGKQTNNPASEIALFTEKRALLLQQKTYELTPRELEIVCCIVEACSNKDIADQLKITEETVKRHLTSIFNKTGVSTRLELALFAIARQLVTFHPL